MILSELPKVSEVTWEVGSQKIFSFGKKCFNESFLTQGENYCFTVLRKREKCFDSSILLITIPDKMEGLANIKMFKDSYEFSRILHSSE